MSKRKAAVKRAKKNLSDAEFFEALRANGGLFSQTARYIEDVHKISYHRATVKMRADKHPELLHDIRQANLDKAEKAIFDAIETSENEKVKTDTAKWYLEKLGRNRGYMSDHNQQKEKQQQINRIKIGDVEIDLNPDYE